MSLWLGQFAWVWQPIVSPSHIVAGATFLVVAAVFAYWRSFGRAPRANLVLLTMRLVWAITLAVLLFGPSTELPPRTDSEKSQLRILLDTSASMQTNDCQSRSRFDFAVKRWLNDEVLAKLGQHHQVRLQQFSDQLRPLTKDHLNENAASVATGRATFLADKVRTVLSQVSSNRKPTELLVISDGHDHSETPMEPVSALAKSRKAPVYTVTLGGRSLHRDLTVVAVPMQDFLLTNEPGAILVKLYQVGLDDARTSLRMQCGEQIHETEVAFDGQRMLEIQMPIQQSEEGQYEYSIAVEPLAGEMEKENNRQVVFCDVKQRRLKVLLLEGQPYWDTKFLAQSLRKDERIQLVQVTQVSLQNRETILSRAQTDLTADLPDSVEKWQAYDLVVLGRGLHHLLEADNAKQLVNYVVDGGGNVVFARGRAGHDDHAEEIWSQLSVLEPVVWAPGDERDLPISLTNAGKTSPFLSAIKMGMQVDEVFSQLPGLESVSLMDRTKPAAVVLAETVDPAGNAARPALALMQVGRGHVVSLLGQGTWRWSLLSPEHQELAGFYDAFWSNLVRWLVMGSDFPPGQQVTLGLSRTSARLGDPLVVDVALKRRHDHPSEMQLHIREPSGNVRSLQLSKKLGHDLRYRAEFETQQQGIHVVTLEAPGFEPVTQQRKLNVYDIDMERLEASANPQVMRLLAEQSGGQTINPDHPEQLIDLLHQKRMAFQYPPETVYVWDRGAFLFLLVAWAGMEWILRRLTGLL